MSFKAGWAWATSNMKLRIPGHNPRKSGRSAMNFFASSIDAGMATSLVQV
jgi:hypothetical protein